MTKKKAKKKTLKKKNKPKFNVLNDGFKKRVKSRWRKPRGTHNKKRMRMAWTGAAPRVGYRNPEALRDLHPNGQKEVLVHNVAGLEELKDVLIRIASKVGAKKREQIEKKAESMKLKVVNKRKKKPEPKKVKKEEKPKKAAKGKEKK